MKSIDLHMHSVCSDGTYTPAQLVTYAKKKGLSIHDIAGEPFVLTEYGQGYRKLLDKALAKCSLEIEPVLEIGRTDMITSVLTQSNMISFLPDFVTKAKVQSGELCYLDVCDMDLTIYKQLIYHKNKWLSKSMKVFIEYLKQVVFSN